MPLKTRAAIDEAVVKAFGFDADLQPIRSLLAAEPIFNSPTKLDENLAAAEDAEEEQEEEEADEDE